MMLKFSRFLMAFVLLRTLQIWVPFFGMFAVHTLEVQAQARTVAVQMFQWNWNSIARECEEYLGPTGFAAVLVPPPHEHIVLDTAPWWERYQVVSYKLGSRSGNRDQFIAMVNSCKNAGVDVYVDAVINHTTGFPSGTGFLGSQFTQYSYPGIYSSWDFNYCNVTPGNDIYDYEDRFQVQYCELLDLADLATSSDYVQKTLNRYMQDLADLGVSGFRIDAAKHIPAQDLKAIYGNLGQTHYIFQELILGDASSIQFGEYQGLGDVTYYPYPLWIGGAFKKKNLSSLKYLSRASVNTSDAVVFVDNHDIQRMDNRSDLLTFSRDPLKFRLAQAFMLSFPYGYPFLLSSYAFSDYNEGPPLNPDGIIEDTSLTGYRCEEPWLCEHRLQEIPFLVRFRNETDSEFYISRWVERSPQKILFTRSSRALAAFNVADSSPWREEITSLLEIGTYCGVEVSSSNTYKPFENPSCPFEFQVNGVERLEIQLNPGTALLLLKTDP